ncbi:MAG: hypothetical protein VYA26_03660, partial [Actinomycetota bacterium]|nr:hypothetical protein [Actinomycetota bacterium]
VVLAIDGDGDRAEAVVRFASKGEKRLLLAWAPLARPDPSGRPRIGWYAPDGGPARPVTMPRWPAPSGRYRPV